MTQEFKKIIEAAAVANKKGLNCLLASLVALDGSSYRKPGVRMLILEDGQMIGALSGGCVEKEVLKQSQELFESKTAKLIRYDGRYRLGCEGALYILVEPFHPSENFINAFYRCLEKRENFIIHSFFRKEEGLQNGAGSRITFKNENQFSFSNTPMDSKGLECFSEELTSILKLMVFGTEHDAKHLSQMASILDWEVIIIASPKVRKDLRDFPGAKEIWHIAPEELSSVHIDGQTAIVLMTHNYALDLQYLLNLKNCQATYIGILGPVKRKNQLLDELILHQSDVDLSWLEKIKGPAGLDIGSISPQEITISILSEILAIKRNRQANSLSERSESLQNTEQK
ncbi:XdhC family protein [Hyphobacterium sp. CCMP332]|nr:XdhC family protein [Hyphobacterium sp. CCMP332]